MTSQTDLFKQINNAVLDLQASELQTYEYPLRTLGRLLQNDDLAEANRELTKDVDFEAFINESPPSQGSFVGTGRLAWPDDPKKVLGLKLILIKKLSEDPDYAIQFGHTYYYSGSKVIAGLHSIVRQLLIPFFRDYKEYVLNRSSFLPRVISAASNKVFVVYGHDGEARETVARFLENAGFAPIILHEQANMGRTIIEKVEANSDVGFAVVLLTPDDEGCEKGGVPEPRARQNVLLALGFFLGHLGRPRVCALKKGIVEIPSDFAGVVWEPMDTGTWRQSLGRELQAAGYTIDWNKIMK